MQQNDEKNKRFQEIFEESKRDQNKLFQLLKIGRNQGFDNSINRKKIWPYLLELDQQKIKDAPVFEWKSGMNNNSIDFQQLQKDADRSLTSMKTFEQITKFHLKKKQQAVLSVLNIFFAKNPQLKYIQGYHDVASIFLILFGNSTGYYLIEKAGQSYFYDFLRFQFGELGIIISQIVYEIVIRTDPQFKNILKTYHQTKLLIFILPWILTWFSHNFKYIKDICRIWDYLFCTGPQGVFFLSAAIILSTKKQLKDNCTEFDDANIQTFYQNQANNSQLDINKSLKISMQLQQQIQIRELSGYKKLNQKSMLRLQNFYQIISIHKKYHLYLMKQKHFKKIIKIGIPILIVGTMIAYIALKYASKTKGVDL